MGKNIREKVKCKLTMATSSLQFPTTRSSGLGRINGPTMSSNVPTLQMGLKTLSLFFTFPCTVRSRYLTMYNNVYRQEPYKTRISRFILRCRYSKLALMTAYQPIMAASHTCIYTYIHTQTLKRQREIYTHELIIKRGAKLNDF